MTPPDPKQPRISNTTRAAQDREKARLAQALKANLKRRKAAPRNTGKP